MHQPPRRANSPGRTNAVAGHLAVVAQQLVIALHDAPGGNADADHSSCPLLTLQEQGVAHLLGHACSEQRKYTNNGRVEQVRKQVCLHRGLR